MAAFDIAVLAVIAFSVILGLWRGVVSEILALVAWIAALLAARQFGHDAGGLFAGWVSEPVLATVAGYVAVVVVVLVAFAIARRVLSMVLKAVGLGLVDRLLGGVFGVVRGLLVVLAAVLVAGMTPLPKEPWWRSAMLAPPLETAVIAAKPWLPPEVAKRIRYR